MIRNNFCDRFIDWWAYFNIFLKYFYFKSINCYDKWLLTLTGSPILNFFCRNFSRLGGATSTTYGFKSDARNNLRLCGCKFSTQILPLETTVRIASSDVPVYNKKKKCFQKIKYQSQKQRIRKITNKRLTVICSFIFTVFDKFSR